MRKVLYYVEPKSPLVKGSACLFGLSFLLRLAWALLFPEEARALGPAVHCALPLLSCAAFIVLLLRYGRDRLGLTLLPTLGGVLFFILKATGFTPVHQALCTVLYLGVALLYGAAVLGLFPAKPLLLPLFGLPLLVHIAEDLIFDLTVYTLSEWLREGSVLAIMAGLLSVSLAMRRSDP